MTRSRKDFLGTQLGSRRNLVTYRNASVRCCSSKWRKYFCTIFGMVMRRAAEKLRSAMASCFSGFSRNRIRQSAKSPESPGR